MGGYKSVCKNQVNCEIVVARRGAHLAAERSEGERSGAKRRGRGIGRRNTKNIIDILFSNFMFKYGYQERYQIAEKIQSRGC